MTIDKKDTIGEVVSKDSRAADIMMKYGLHCIGCGVAYWESIEDGCKGHGMTDEMIDKMVKDINSLSKIPLDDNLIISGSAKEKLRELLSKKGDKILKIGIIKGDAGERYMLEFIDDNPCYKILHDKEGIKIAAEEKDYDKMKCSRIDYVKSMSGAGFKISKIEN